MQKDKNVSTKRVLLIIILIFFINDLLWAQCINGDCGNGIGKATYYNGIYEGEFKDSLPHGKGEWLGKVSLYNGNTDSIKDVGVFYQGTFMKGKRAVLAYWSGHPDNKYNQRFATYPKVDGYFIVPELKAPKEYDYPTDAINKYKAGKKELKGYDYKTYRGIRFSWYGKLKKGLMDGEGVFVLDGNCIMQFDEGKPVGVTTVCQGDWGQIKYHGLKSISFADGKIDGLVFINNLGDSLSGEFKTSLFNIPDLMQIDGFYTIKYNNGNFYKGGVQQGKPHGYGEMLINDGTAYRGYYYKGYSHGMGTFFKGETLQDSGLYVFNRLIKGVTLLDGKYITYPICVNGNCENGFGKANYAIGANAAVTNTYEGNFVNAIPFGFGEYLYQNGENKHSKKGSFSAGQLMGEGTIIANYGNLRKITGWFKSDTLINGAVDYADGTRYESELMYPLVFGIHEDKNVRGSGTYYTKKGGVVTGEFYKDIPNRLFKASYQNAEGVLFNFDYNYNDVAKQYGVSSYYDIDDLDNLAAAVMVRKVEVEAEKEYQKKVYAYKKEQRAKQAVANADAANWKTDERKERCSACDGAGHITYTNTFGGGTSTTIVDQKGYYISGGDVRPGRTYTNKVTCRACNGEGKILIKTRKYVGPIY